MFTKYTREEMIRSLVLGWAYQAEKPEERRQRCLNHAEMEKRIDENNTTDEIATANHKVMRGEWHILEAIEWLTK